jgi:hypothetical protein
VLTNDSKKASNLTDSEMSVSQEPKYSSNVLNSQLPIERDILPFPEMEFDFDDLEVILDT